jgi:cytochrome P450
VNTRSYRPKGQCEDITTLGGAVNTPLTIDLRDANFWQNPYPVWRRAMDQCRTARTTTGEVILLRADDFDEALADPTFLELGVGALERLGICDGPFYEWRRLTMAACDGADHDRKRFLVARAFTPRRVERLRASLATHAASRLAAATARDGTFDVVADYAADLPLWLICEFLGLPVASRAEIDEFLTGTEEAFADPMTAERRQNAETGIVELSHFVERLIAERLRTPGEDLVSDLLEAESAGRVGRAELIALVVNVIGGAVGSSRAGIANSILLLLRHPEQARWVRQDPNRIRPAIEECLRYYPPFRAGRRKVLTDVDRFGVHLEAGATVYMARQAANRDADRWPDPDEFNVARPENRHYSFGYGPHFCLGQALARLDIQEAVGQFLKHCPDARLVSDPPKRVPFTPDEQIVELPVTKAR